MTQNNTNSFQTNHSMETPDGYQNRKNNSP